MYGWRFWQIGTGADGGQRLVAPFVSAPKWRLDNPGITRPTVTPGADGTFRAECPYGCENIPGRCGLCGLYFCDSPASLLKLAPRNNGFVDLRHPAFAVTLGEVTGPMLADPWHFPEVWNAHIGSRHEGSFRSAAYRVLAIAGTAVAGLRHYGVPIYEGVPTLKHLQRAERRWRTESQS